MERLFTRLVTAALAAALVTAAAGSRPLRAGATSPRAGSRLTVMSYNIHVGVGMDKRQDLRRIADVIRRSRADLVGLQEVDRGVERTGRVDEIKELARLTGMDYAFAHNLDYQGGQYGVAVLSRFPILAIDHRRYAPRQGRERRGFIRVEVEAGGRRLNFVTTHLDYQSAEGRLHEARQMLDALRDVRGPLVVTGDFNEEPAGAVCDLMRAAGFADAWTRGTASATHGDGATYPADAPKKRIDYVFQRGLDEDEAAPRSVPDTLASDHRPVVVGLRLGGR